MTKFQDKRFIAVLFLLLQSSICHSNGSALSDKPVHPNMPREVFLDTQEPEISVGDSLETGFRVPSGEKQEGSEEDPAEPNKKTSNSESKSQD